MTFDEVLNACPGGLPAVVYQDKIGQVVEVKNNGNYKGIAVKFTDVPHDSWFYAEDGNDGRKKYMKDLELVESN